MKLAIKLSTDPATLQKLKQKYEDLKNKYEVMFNFQPAKTLTHQDGSVLGADSPELKKGTKIYIQTESKEWKPLPDGMHEVVSNKGERASIKVEAGIVTEINVLTNETKAPQTIPPQKEVAGMSRVYTDPLELRKLLKY